MDISSPISRRFRAVRSRFASGMDPACGGGADRLARQRRNVVGGGGAAGGPGRFRRRPRHRVAGLHHGDAGFWRRRRADRQDHRPLRHRRRDRIWYRHPWPRLSRRRNVVVDLAVHPGAFRDRPRLVGDLRAADGGSLALVQPLPRSCGRDRRQRQLHRRHDLAVVDQFRHAVGRLAPHPYRARRHHRGHHDTGADFAAPADGGRGAAQPCQRRRRRASTCGSRPMR